MSEKMECKSSEKEKENKSGWTSKKIAYLGMFVSIAMVFSYLESMIPVNIAVPGVKLGLANLVAIVVMFRMDVRSAWVVTMVRVLLSTLLFGNLSIMVYSLAGAVLSLTMMSVCAKLHLFGMLGTSILGAVSHNAGQIVMAAVLMKSGNIMLYIPVLCISGSIAGICIGIAGVLIAGKIPRMED